MKVASVHFPDSFLEVCGRANPSCQAGRRSRATLVILPCPSKQLRAVTLI